MGRRQGHLSQRDIAESPDKETRFIFPYPGLTLYRADPSLAPAEAVNSASASRHSGDTLLFPGLGQTMRSAPKAFLSVQFKGSWENNINMSNSRSHCAVKKTHKEMK